MLSDSSGIHVYCTFEQGIVEIMSNTAQALTGNYITGIVNSIVDPVFIKNNISELVLVNDAFCQLFGMASSAIIGKTLAEEVAPEEMDDFLRVDREVIATGVRNVREETLTVRDGPTRNITTRKSRLIGKDGYVYLVGTIRDSEAPEAPVNPLERLGMALMLLTPNELAIVDECADAASGTDMYLLSEVLRKLR